MSRLGPVITLVAGAVLAAGLGVASVNATPAANTAAPTVENTVENTIPDTVPDEEQTAEEPAQEAQPTPTPERTEEKKIAKADYGGRVTGNGGLIAISIRNGKAVGYFCDGRAEAWFKGTQSGDSVSLTGVKAGKVTADLAGGRATGRLALGGKKWSFVAQAVRKPSGLYRATALVRGAQYRAGWIRIKNPDGSYTSVGAATSDDSLVPVPTLNPDQPTAPLTVDGTTVYPKDVDGFIEEMP
ncbi:hypothetical protein ABZ907_14065 [Nonomuraea wenchangensis]